MDRQRRHAGNTLVSLLFGLGVGATLLTFIVEQWASRKEAVQAMQVTEHVHRIASAIEGQAIHEVGAAGFGSVAGAARYARLLWHSSQDTSANKSWCKSGVACLTVPAGSDLRRRLSGGLLQRFQGTFVPPPSGAEGVDAYAVTFDGEAGGAYVVRVIAPTTSACIGVVESFYGDALGVTVTNQAGSAQVLKAVGAATALARADLATACSGRAQSIELTFL